MARNAWFKHYNDASQGNTLRLLWSKKDDEAIAFWWLLLELLSRWENPERRGEIVLSWEILARETNRKPSRCKRVMTRISSVSQIELNEKPDGTFTFVVPNWLELQERRGGKRESKNDQSFSKIRQKREIEEEREKEEQKPPASFPENKSQEYTPKPEDVSRCKSVWLETLQHFGEERGVSAGEETTIWRSIKAERDPEIVAKALEGARYEERSATWNPGVDIVRILMPDKKGNPRIQRAVGWLANHNKSKIEWRTATDAVPESD